MVIIITTLHSISIQLMRHFKYDNYQQKKLINAPLKQCQRVLNVESLAQATRTSQEILCQEVPLTYFSLSTQNISARSTKTFQYKLLTLHEISKLFNKLLSFTSLHQENKPVRYTIPIICYRCNKFRTNVTVTMGHNETV